MCSLRISNDLRETLVEIVSNEECERASGTFTSLEEDPMTGFPVCVSEIEDSYAGRITEQMICAGDLINQKGDCNGDSGGPMTVKNKTGQHTLAGVISWGFGCAEVYKWKC